VVTEKIVKFAEGTLESSEKPIMGRQKNFTVPNPKTTALKMKWLLKKTLCLLGTLKQPRNAQL